MAGCAALQGTTGAASEHSDDDDDSDDETEELQEGRWFFGGRGGEIGAVLLAMMDGEWLQLLLGAVLPEKALERLSLSLSLSLSRIAVERPQWW